MVQAGAPGKLDLTVHHPNGKLWVLDKTRDWEKVVK